MKSKYDVVVVGGGPAGLTAARFAALGGVDVLLVERHNRIGQHLCCAEGVTLTGLTAVTEPEDEWISSKISGVKLISPSGDTAFIDHPNAGYTLDRSRFEPYLAALAADEGAEVALGCRAENPVRGGKRFAQVDVVTNDETRKVECGVLIAADGVESSIARDAGLTENLIPSRLASCAQYRLEKVDIEAEIPELYLDHGIAPGGYTWVFPKGPDSANVGLGVIPTVAGDRSPFDYLDDFVRRRFESYTITQRVMGIVPLFEGRKTMLKDNLMAVGDSARLIDSLTGAGIATALYSGRLAGELAAEYVRDGHRADILKQYPKRFMKKFGRKLRLYSLAHEVFRRLKPEEFDLVINIANEVFGGKKVYAIDTIDILRKVFKRKPGLLKYAPHLVWK
jgi:digeranylgeranylglycerophospholipid reductase